MDVKQVVLFDIFERSYLKKRECAKSNIIMHLQKTFGYEDLSSQELEDMVSDTIIQLKDNDLIDAKILKINDDDLRLGFSIKDEKLEYVKKLYIDSANERYAQLNSNEKQLLHEIYMANIVFKKPYSLNELTKGLATKENYIKLHEQGFCNLRQEYYVDSERVDGANLSITNEGKNAFELNNPQYSKTKYKEHVNLLF